MCGISGIIVKNNTFKINIDSLIDNLINFQERRGPDASGKYITNTLGLGHNRLSIQDIDKRSNQPFLYKNLVMVFNGEIYNYIELKKNLINEDDLITESDTEVLIKLFHKNGINKTLDLLNGMFSIALYDKNINKLYLIRDRLGIKQCYFYEDTNKFIFSSTPASIAKTLNKLEKKKLSINTNSLFHYLSGGICLTTSTMFNGINGLEPGSYLEFDITNFSKKKIKWWKFKNNKQNNNIEEIIKKSVHIRNRSNTNGYVLFSGGIDSSIIVNNSDKFNILSLDVGEYKYAEKIAEELKKKERLFKIDKEFVINETKYFIEEQRKIINFTGIPVRASFLMTICGKYIYNLNKKSDNRHKIVLSGIGGNELFYGHRRMKLTEHGMEDHIKNIYHYLSQIETIDNKYKDSFIKFKETLIDEILNNNILPDNINKKNIHRWLEIKTFLLNDLLINSDAIFMYYSLESRVPFLDHNIVEYIMSCPPGECFYNSEEIMTGVSWRNYTKNNKKQLKEILKKQLSDESLHHPKFTYELQRHLIGPMYYNLCDKFIARSIIKWNGPWTKFNATLVGNLELWFQEFEYLLII